MTFAPTYFCFGCNSIAHNARTAAYIGWACRTNRFTSGDPAIMAQLARGLCSCKDDDEVFVSPIADNACWYDARIPESADFLGVIVRQADGVHSSSFKRELADSIADGSILQRPTIGGKQMVFDLMLVATSRAGLNYGAQWLRRALEGNQRCGTDGSTCASCQGQMLTIRTHCPTQSSVSPKDRGLHSWAAAGAIDGLDPIDEDPLGAVNCNLVRAYTVTLATERFESYSTDPIESQVATVSSGFTTLGNCLIVSQLPTLSDVCCPICNTGCDPCTSDPACDCMPPFVLKPEVVTGGAPCFSEPVCRCVKAVQFTNVPAGYATALRMTARSGHDPQNPIFTRYGMRNFVMRVFENPPTATTQADGPDLDLDPDILDLPNGWPLPISQATYEQLVAKVQPCAEIGVSWMPAGSELVVDGLSGRTWLKCNGKCVDHSARVYEISGSIFPLEGRCSNIVVTMEWDCLNSQGRVAADTVVSELQVDRFLGFNL